MDRLRVLFLCTGNSARSQVAEALLRQLSHGRADVLSAGAHPRPSLHPKPLRQFIEQTFDYIITACDRAEASCPVFPGDPERIHWSFEDPAAAAERTRWQSSNRPR